MKPDDDSRRRLLLAMAIIAVITVAHFLVGTGNHFLHGVHITLGVLYLFPVLQGAMARGLAGGIGVSILVSALYFAHLRIVWGSSPLRNMDQFAMIAAYLFVGISSGALISLADRRRAERDAVIAKARFGQMLEGLHGLTMALGERNPETLEHSVRVADLAVRIGQRLGLDDARLQQLRLAGLLHDVGKIGMPDDVLLSDGPLSDEQRVRMNKHVESATQMIRRIPEADAIADIVEGHHETPDGTGYPHGLPGDQILPESQILRVADVFDAMTSERSYQAARSPEAALETLQRMAANRKVDPASVAALTDLLREGLGESQSVTDVSNAQRRS